jgi:DNA-directed RNA polymerase
LIGISLRSLADAIRAEQDSLKTSKKTLPAWGLPLLFLGHEQMALITIGTLFNMIARSEFETCLPPRITPVAHEIGQLCRIERLADLAKHRAADVAELLLTRNRNRNAAKRAAEWAALVDDENDWANNFRAHHLGEKLISLALRFAVFEGKPIFEAKEDREGSGKGLKKMQRIGMTEAAETWIGEQTPEALDLFNPIYVPMIVEPRPWTSLSEGGYLVTPMKLFKRQTGKRAQQRLAKADLSAVYAAVNALQNTPYRINEAVYRFQRDAWAAGLPFFGLNTEDQRHERLRMQARQRAARNQKGLQKTMAFRFGQSVRLSAEERFYFPCQVDHRGRAYPVPQLMNPQSDHIGRARRSSSLPMANRWANAECTGFRSISPIVIGRARRCPLRTFSPGFGKTKRRSSISRQLLCKCIVSGQRPTSRGCSWPHVSSGNATKKKVPA